MSGRAPGNSSADRWRKLEHQLRDSSTTVRALAINELAHDTSSESTRILIRMLDDRHLEIQHAAFRALDGRHEPAVTAAMIRCLEARGARQDYEAGTAPMMKILANRPDHQVAVAMARWLVRQNTERTFDIEYLEESLEARDRDVVSQTIVEILDIRRLRHANNVTSILNHCTPETRYQLAKQILSENNIERVAGAILALKADGTPAAGRLLLSVLRVYSGHLQKDHSWLLGREAWRIELAVDVNPDRLCREAIEELRSRTNPETTQALCDCAEDSDPEIRMIPALCLAKHSSGLAMPSTGRAMQSSKSAQETSRRLLSDPDPYVRLAAVEACRWHFEPETLQDLFIRLSDSWQQEDDQADQEIEVGVFRGDGRPQSHDRLWSLRGFPIADRAFRVLSESLLYRELASSRLEWTSNSSERIRAGAAALLDPDDDGNQAVFRELLNDSDAAVRWVAIDSVQFENESERLSAFSRQLDDSSPLVTRLAARRLLRECELESDVVRKWLDTHLNTERDPISAGPFGVVHGALEVLGHSTGDGLLIGRFLLRGMNSSLGEIRLAASAAALSAPTSWVALPLRDYEFEDPGAMSATAAQLFGICGEPAAARYVAEAITSGNPATRLAATTSAGLLGVEDTFESLCRIIVYDSPDSKIREAAQLALTQISPAVRGSLRKNLSEDTSQEILRASALALGSGEDFESVNRLSKLLSHPQAEVRQSAAHALVSIGDQLAASEATESIPVRGRNFIDVLKSVMQGRAIPDPAALTFSLYGGRFSRAKRQKSKDDREPDSATERRLVTRFRFYAFGLFLLFPLLAIIAAGTGLGLNHWLSGWLNGHLGLGLMPAADSVGLRESAGITTGICVWVPLLLLVFLKLIPQVLSIDGTELEEFVFRRLFRPVMLTIAWTIAMAPVVFVLVAALLYLANPSLVDRYSRLDELLSILGRSTVGVCTAAIILFGFRPIWHYLLYRLQAQDIHRLLRGEPMTEMEELLDRPTWPVVTLALTVTGLFTLLPAYFVIGLFSVLLCLTVVLAVIGEFTFQDMYGNWQFDETTSGDVLLGPWAARLGIAALVGMAVWPVEVLLLWFLKGRCQAAVEHVLVPITGQGASDALFRDTDFLSPWLLMATAAFALMTGQVVIWVFRKRLPSTDTPIVPVAVMLVLIMPWALFIIFWKLLLTLDLPAVAGHGGVVWLALHGGWFLALCLLELILWVALVRQHDLARPTASMIGTGLLGAAVLALGMPIAVGCLLALPTLVLLVVVVPLALLAAIKGPKRLKSAFQST